MKTKFCTRIRIVESVYLGLPDSLIVSERFESLGERPELETEDDLEWPLLGLSEEAGRDEELVGRL